jgi:hypothetical protein
MIAFICIFLLPILSVWIHFGSRAFARDNLLKSARAYVGYAVSIAFLCCMVIVYGFHNTGDIVANIAKYGDFAAHYFLLSGALALSLPLLMRSIGAMSIQCAWKPQNCPVNRALSSSALKRTALLVSGIMLTILMLLLAFDNTFWGDEAFSILLIEKSVPEIITATAQDVHPPLYYLILKFFVTLFGHHGWIYHLVSIVPAVLELIFAMTLVRRRFGYKTALIFMLLAVLTKPAMTYNVEVRMYSWANLLVLLNFWYALNLLIRQKKTDWIFFVLSGVGAAYTHYYALISVAVIYLGVFAVILHRDARRWKACVLCGAVTAAAYLPWLNILLASFRRTSENWWATDIPTVKQSLDFMFGNNRLGGFLLWAGLIALALYLLFSLIKLSIVRTPDATRISIQNPASSSERTTLNAFLIIGLAAILGTFLAGEAVSHLIRPMFRVRYLYCANGILWMLLAILLSKVCARRWLAIALSGLILVLGLQDWNDTCKYYKWQDQNTMATLQYMQTNANSDDLLMSNIDHLTWTVLDCYFPHMRNAPFSIDALKDSNANTVWLLLSSKLDDTVIAQIQSAGYENQYLQSGHFGTYNYALYRLDYIKPKE